MFLICSSKDFKAIFFVLGMRIHETLAPRPALQRPCVHVLQYYHSRPVAILFLVVSKVLLIFQSNSHKMAGRKGEERLDSKIIIRNYPPETSDKDMRIMFEKYGKIDDCKLPSYRYNGINWLC